MKPVSFFAYFIWLALAIPSVAIAGAPQITSTAPLTVEMNQAYLYQVESTDPLGDEVTYYFGFHPDGMTISEEGLVSWVPSEADLGVNAYNIYVENTAGDKSYQYIPLNVYDPNNTAPVISGVPIREIAAGDDYSFDTLPSDADGDPLTYSFRVSPSTPAVTLSTEGQLSWATSQADVGSYWISITARDGRGGFDTLNYTLNVLDATNATPVIDNRDPEETTHYGVEYTYDAHATDPDGDSLTYRVTSWPAIDNISISDTGLLSWTPRREQGRKYGITVYADDGRSGVDSFKFYLKVNDDNNLAPVVNNHSYTPQIAVGDVHTYDTQTTDPEGDPIYYFVRSVPEIEGISISDTGVVNWPTTAADEGRYKITLKIHDNFITTSYKVYDLVVGNPEGNSSPNILSNPPLTAVVGQTYHYQVNGEDLDNDPLRYYFKYSPAGMAIDEATGLITWVPTSTDIGSHHVKVKAADDISLTTFQSYYLTVTDGSGNSNSVPIANASQEVVVEDGSLDITLQGSDSDNDALTYILVNSVQQGVLTGDAPNFSYTPNANFNGTDQLTFKVNDGVVDSALATVGITVTPKNDSPNALGQSTSVDEDTSTTIILSGSDIENTALTYRIVIAPQFGILSGDAPNLVYTPSQNVNGLDQFTFAVSDGELESTPATVELTINAVNDIPAALPQEIILDEDTSVDITLTGSDVENSELTFTLLSQPSFGALSGSAPNIIYTPSPEYSGNDQFTFLVNDGVTDSVSSTIFITVNALNDTPTAIPLNFSINEDETQVVTLQGEDVENSVLTFIVDAPPSQGVLSGVAPDLLYTPNSNYFGIDRFSYSVNDGEASSITVDVSIDVLPINDAPEFTVLPITTADVGIAYVSDVDAIDIESGDNLVYQLVAPPTGMTIDSVSGVINWTPLDSQIGSNVFDLVVTDAENLSTTQPVTIVVSSAYNPPIFTTTAPPSAVTAHEYQYFSRAEGGDARVTRYGRQSGPLGLGVNRHNGAVEWTPTLEQLGEHEVVIYAEDLNGVQKLHSFTVSVTENQPPVFVTTAPEAAITGHDYRYFAKATDLENDTVVYEKVSGPDGLTVDRSRGTVAWLPGADQIGTFEVVISADDQRGKTVLQPFPITVTQNSVPVFNSTPPHTTPVGVLFQYVASATDADGDTLHFRRVSDINGVTVNASSGLMQWTPTEDQADVYEIVIEASDQRGGVTLHSFPLKVNGAPRITSTPPVTVNEGEVYRYNFESVDPNENDILRYSNGGYRTGYSLNAVTGAFSWRHDTFIPVFSTAQHTYCGVPVADNEDWFDTRHWTVLRYPGNHGGVQRWNQKEDSAIANGNGDASILLSDIDITDGVVELNLRVSGADDDQIGFVWGFEDTEHYYRLMWDQGNGAGLRVTLVNSPEPRFGSGHPTDIHLFVDSQFRWKRHTDYRLVIDIKPGATFITILENERLVKTVLVRDDSYRSGKFGFFSASQGGVNYSARFLDRTSSPDLAVSQVLRSESGTEEIYQTTVVNRGAAPSAATDLRLRAGLQSTVNVKELSTVAIDALAVGESITVPIVIPRLSGNFDFVEAVVNPSNEFPECDRFNNRKVLPHMRVGVIDEDGLKFWQNWTIDVNNVNEAPVLTTTAPEFVALGDIYTYNMIATDTDLGDYVSYEVLDGPPGMAFYLNTGFLLWTPENADLLQSYPVTLVASDLEGATVIEQFSLTVQQKPEITSTPIYVGRTGESYGYDVEAIDPDNDTLTYSLVESPSGMTIDSVTGLISWTAEATGDIHNVIVRVDDGRQGIVDQEYPLSVLAVGDINVVPDLSANTPPASGLSGSLYSYTFTVDDTDGLAPRFSLLDAPFNMSLGAISGELTWLPPFTSQAEHPVTVQVYDQRGGFDTYAFVIRLAGVANGAPSIDNNPDVVAFNNVAYQYQVMASDPDDDALTYSLAVAPEGMTISDAGLLEWVPVQAQLGLQSVRLEVFDSEGNGAVKSFDILVRDDTSRAPKITSDPVRQVAIDGEYRYDVNATDIENQSITFSLVLAPQGMTIDGVTGVITWSPVLSDRGAQPVEVVATDTEGLFDRQEYYVSVSALAENRGPEAGVIMPPQGIANRPYTYTLPITDPNSDPLNFTLLTAPDGISVDTFGRLSWAPTLLDVGSHTLKVRADDNAFFLDVEFSIEVLALPAPIEVSAVITPEFALPNDPINITLSALGGVGLIEIASQIDGVSAPIELDVPYVFTTDVVGRHTISVIATDGESTEISNHDFFIGDPADVSAPLVDIHNLSTGDTVTAPSDVVVSVQDDNLASAIIVIREKDATDHRVIYSGTANLNNEVATRFDPTLLMNGQYEIILQATDINGLSATDGVTVIVDGDLKVGNFSFTVQDFNIGMVGIPVSVSRTYDSRRRHEDLDFGYGWTIDYQNVKVEESTEPSEGWYQERRNVLFTIDDEQIVLPGTCTEPLGPKLVTVTLPDGDIEKFNVTSEIIGGGATSETSPNCYLVAGRFVRLNFSAEEGTFSTLETVTDHQLYLSDVSGGNLSGDITEDEAFNITKYRLTTRAGYVYDLDQDFGIETVTDPNGHSLTYNESGISHSSGKSLIFNRDLDSGRIVSIEDPKGNTYEYRYSAAGDLLEATAPDAFAIGEEGTSFIYDNQHSLVDIIDPLNRRIVRNIYDDEGRLIGQEDENGVTKTFDHNVDERTSFVTDRDGRSMLINYDDRGNVLSETKVIGDGSYPSDITTTYTYDSNDNQQTRMIGGNTWVTLHSEKDEVLETRNPLGESMFFDDYNSRGQEGAIIDERGHVYKMSFDSVGNLLEVLHPQVTDPDTGEVRQPKAVSVFNERGLLTSYTDVRGLTTQYSYYIGGSVDGQKKTESNAITGTVTYAYDENNNIISEVHERTIDGIIEEEITTYTYDKRDRLTVVTYPDGSTSETTYDLVGNVAGQRDRFGNLTEYDYDLYGQILLVTHADGTTERNTYTAAGFLHTVTDRLGRVMSNEYDDAGRLWREHSVADNTFTETRYTVHGWVAEEFDQNRNRIEYKYNDAGYRTQIVRYLDGIPLIHSFTYYPGGQIQSETDARGHVTSYVLNELDQRITSNYQNGTSIGERFDFMGTRIRSVDQESLGTNFFHDKFGRLLGVQQDTSIDGLIVPATTYTYDEVGNRLTQVDAKGNVTAWSYDSFGRILKRVLPMGQYESFVYIDGKGCIVDSGANCENTVSPRLVIREDFNGDAITMAYDIMGRLVSTSYSKDGRIEVMDYYNDGQLRKVENHHGITLYSYDVRNRLIREQRSDGITMAYTYDKVGNRTEVSVNNNGTVTSRVNYTYDTLNRLKSVVDGSGTTTYAYDENGNMTIVVYPNGLRTIYKYNTINQLTDVFTRNVLGTMISHYAYTLTPNGRRQMISEMNGRTTTYGYDQLYRLVTEDVVDQVNGDFSARYQYDWVGNRTLKTIGDVSTIYVYDKNDRLLQAGAKNYTYDLNGNTLTENFDGGINTYVWDGKNRLVSFGNGMNVSTFTYNYNGIRTSKTEGAITTHFVLDENRSYAQVLEEVEGGDVKVRYSYGHNLINQERHGDFNFYHYDGLGSTRFLSDDVGNMTDEYNYEAFGRILSQTGGSENSYLFSGEQFDSSLNQYYLRSRDYSQSVGRFSSMDTWAGDMTRPITLNKYVYGNANPATFTDPTGNYGVIELMEGVHIQSLGRNFTAMQLRRYVKKVITEVVKDVGTVRKKIKKCVNNKNKCDFDAPILVVGGTHPEMADHILDAQLGRGSNIYPSGFLHEFSYRTHSQWYLRKGGCTDGRKIKAISKYGSKVDCDEFPMNSMKKGGKKNKSIVSLRYVPGSQNKSIGGMWSGLAAASGMKSDLKKKALVVAWKEIPVSVGIPQN